MHTKDKQLSSEDRGIMKGSLKKVILELHRGGVCLAACVFELWYLVTQAWCVCVVTHR